MTLVRLESMLPMRVRSLPYRFVSYLIFVTGTMYGFNAITIMKIEYYTADYNEITAIKVPL